MSMPDFEPDVEDVLQVESTEPAVKVKVEGLVRTQQLPSKGGATFTRAVNVTTPVQVLRADPRRRRAVLMSADDILVAFSESTASQASTSFRLLAAKELDIFAVVDIWILGTAASFVSVLTEMWAMGEGPE